MKLFAVYSGGAWAWQTLREVPVRAFAAADASPDKLATLVDAFASMGFLGGGVELEAVRGPEEMKAHAVTAGEKENEEDLGNLKAHLSQGDWRYNDQAELVSVTGYPHVLISFVYDPDGVFFDEKLRYWPQSCIGDSGAFTVWTKGEKIELEDYASWARAYLAKKPDFQFLNLDVIPGDFQTSRSPTEAEREAAMAASLENADALRGLGVPVIEVYHLHEPLSYLEKLAERRQPGVPIGLGGLAGRGVSTRARRHFCDHTFARLRDLSGGWGTLIPIHGLGISPTINIATEFPWYSIDSSSWATPARFGKQVSRSGKAGASRSDSRVSNRDIRRLYLTRMLDGWQAREKALTTMWERRGVRFAE